MARHITKKMRDFADEYLITGNVYQSAIKAGYSEAYARGNSIKLLENESVQKYMQTALEKIQSQKVASIQEVMEYLTRGMRQELEEEVVIVEGCGDGISEARRVKKKISIKDANKCAELLAKRFGMFDASLKVEMIIPVFGGEDGLED